MLCGATDWVFAFLDNEWCYTETLCRDCLLEAVALIDQAKQKKEPPHAT